jgi:uncharacterized protein YcbK (DUF882 family)
LAAFLRAAALAAALALSACAAAPPPAPPAPVPDAVRTLTLRHPWTGETARAAYRRGDAHDPAALAALAAVMRDRRTGEVGPVDPALLDMLWDLRAALGLPEDTPIDVVSGYRSPATNAKLARSNRQVADNSHHLRGGAVDIRIPGVRGKEVAAAAKALGRGGWAHYPETDHVHLDTGPFRTWSGR